MQLSFWGDERFFSSIQLRNTQRIERGREDFETCLLPGSYWPKEAKPSFGIGWLSLEKLYSRRGWTIQQTSSDFSKNHSSQTVRQVYRESKTSSTLFCSTWWCGGRFFQFLVKREDFWFFVRFLLFFFFWNITKIHY